MSDSLRPHGLYSPWNSPGQNTGVGSLSLIQGIFLTQGVNRGLPHCRQILYQLSHKVSPATRDGKILSLSHVQFAYSHPPLSPGGGKGYPLQYSGLENFTDCIAHGVAKSQTQLSGFHCHRFPSLLVNTEADKVPPADEPAS